MSPLLSIVIANYNYGRFLETAILSVVSQEGFDQCELIVVDGGSTDSSVEIIKKYANQIAWWVSEKDRGQSDAFNKGFAHAKGQYLTWLNADDVFLRGTLKYVLQEMASQPNVQWFAGATAYLSDTGRIQTATIPLGNTLPHLLRVPAWMRVSGPSSFFSKELLRQVGLVRLDLRYVMDIDLWMKFYRRGIRLHVINRYIWGFRMHEESKTSSSVTIGQINKRFARERLQVRYDNGVNTLVETLQLLLKRICAVVSLGYIRRYRFVRRNASINLLGE